jgi:hypothetical protein
MTDDRHVRIYEDGTEESLPAITTFRVVSGDRREDEYREHNRRVGRMLEEKGFGIEGDEPGSVWMNRYLRMGIKEDEGRE